MAIELGGPSWVEKDPSTDTEQGRLLWEGVLADTGNPLLMHFLSGLIETAKIPPREPRALARAVQLYAARKIKFFRERPERFQSAMRTVAWGIGDCDDLSRFIAASLRSFRIPVRLVFIRFNVKTKSGEVNRVGHVFPEAHIDGKWVPLESVREYPWGYDPRDKVRRKGVPMDEEVIGDGPE